MSEQSELEFEMSDDLKLEELGYPPELYEVFKENYPDKKVLTQKDTASNDYYLFFLENVKSKKELEAIDSDTLTPKQRELLADKLLLFADVEKIEGKEVELEAPRAEMWAPEDRIVAIHKDSVDAIHVDPETKEEHHATYNRGDPCYMCDREFGCGQTAGCPVCDGLMTAEEFDKHFGSETVELKANETVDVGRLIRENKKFEKSAELYITELARMRAEIKEIKEKAREIDFNYGCSRESESQLIIKNNDLKDAVRELATIFKTAKLGKVKVSTETIQVLKELTKK